MYALFKTQALESIAYIKMYSSLSPTEASETSFAFILMPYSHQKHLVSLQSIQFVFNARGEVTRMNIIYSGDEFAIEKKVKETMAEVVALKLSHERRDALSIFNYERKNLEFSFVDLVEAPAYLSDIIDCIKRLYLMSSDFVQELKPQLLNPEYLAAEFAHLRGNAPEPRHCCAIM
jgi:hypothetical protein